MNRWAVRRFTVRSVADCSLVSGNRDILDNLYWNFFYYFYELLLHYFVRYVDRLKDRVRFRDRVWCGHLNAVGHADGYMLWINEWDEAAFAHTVAIEVIFFAAALSSFPSAAPSTLSSTPSPCQAQEAGDNYYEHLERRGRL